MGTSDAINLKLAQLRAARDAKLKEQSAPSLVDPDNKTIKDDIEDALAPDLPTIPSPAIEVIDKYGKPITLNEKQAEFVELAVAGKSCVLIGAAGTGKSTSQYASTQGMIQSGYAGVLVSEGHKYLESGTPGIVVCAYTRRAVSNIRRNLPANMQSNAITIHKLLEYQPVYYEVLDENTGQEKTKMVFEATRNAGNPLPDTIRVIIFEESSMLGIPLYKEVIDACPHNVQLIFLGDIQQLPPVFGPAILGFKLLELPVVELTEVYRQALESPIISLAHRILSGNPIQAAEYPAWKKPGQLTIHPWKKKIEAIEALNTVGVFFTQAMDNGVYDPDQDIILLPFNKSFGTDELNRKIANHIARKNKRITYEIIAGFNKLYFSEYEHVLYDREDATILSIEPNPTYTGTPTNAHSLYLDYWGHNSEPGRQENTDMDAMDFLLSQAAQAKDVEDRVRQASHRIKLKMNDSDVEVILNTAAEINALMLAYCLTVHKSQGSEWRRVFFVLHQSHATMVQRELLYTGVTRAREELYIICEPETFTKGIEGQRVKGNTLEEKAEFFKGKIADGYEV